MRGTYLWSSALAFTTAASAVDVVALAASVVTSYEYEVLTSELVVTRTIPRYITLTDEAGSATASKCPYFYMLGSTNLF